LLRLGFADFDAFAELHAIHADPQREVSMTGFSLK